MSAELEAIVQRVLGNKLSQDEQQALVLAINSGQATLVTGDRALALGGKADNAVLVTGDQNIVGDFNIVGNHNIIFKGADAEVIRQYVKQPLVDTPENLPRSGAIVLVGRNKELTTLCHNLHNSKDTSMYAITGMGGIGKTELALQYALEYKHKYTGGIFWLQSRGVELGIQIVQFSRARLQLNPSEDFDLLTQVGFCWSHWPQGNVLVIIDDVTNYAEIKPYLPPIDPRFKVLFTSRLRFGKNIKQLELEKLEESDALRLLESFLGTKKLKNELDDAQKLCSWVAFLPLGIELIGRYLSRKPDLALEQVLKRLEVKRLESPVLNKPEPEMTGGLGVLDALGLSWEMLDPSSKKLGCLMSLFSLAPIPWELVEQCFPEVDHEDLEDIRDDKLMGLHLLQRKGDDLYQLHHLLREFFQSRATELDTFGELKKRVCRSILASSSRVPGYFNRMLLIEIQPLIPHLSEVVTSFLPYLEDVDFLLPFRTLGCFYEGQGFLNKAEFWYQNCLLECGKRFEFEQIETAQTLTYLALNYCSQGLYLKAEPLFTRALSIRESILGKEDSFDTKTQPC